MFHLRSTNLLNHAILTTFHYLSILVVYPNIVTISESFKILTYINVGGTAGGSPVIFLEPQQIFAKQEHRVRAKLSKTFKLLIFAVFAQALYYKQNSYSSLDRMFLHIHKQVPTVKMSQSTYCSSFFFLLMDCSANLYYAENTTQWSLSKDLFHQYGRNSYWIIWPVAPHLYKSVM